MAPPETPSPHRFLIPPKSTRPTHPSSSLRFQSRPILPSSPSSLQFVPTPRFTFSSTQNLPTTNNSPTTQYSSPVPITQQPRTHLPPAFATKKTQEEIDELGSAEEDGSDEYIDPEDEFGFNPPQPPSPKRRKIGEEAIAISSSPDDAQQQKGEEEEEEDTDATPVLSRLLRATDGKKKTDGSSIRAGYLSPPLPHRTGSRPKFVFPAPTEPSQHRDNIRRVPPRPPLILPPRTPSPPPAETLAQWFSPSSRRGVRYLPGGLAAGVRECVFETVGVGRRRKEGGWDGRFTICEVGVGGEGGGMHLVRGEEGGGWILVGDGVGSGNRGRLEGKSEVRVGSVVVVREPIWEVIVEGGMWRVVVEWGLE